MHYVPQNLDVGLSIFLNCFQRDDSVYQKPAQGMLVEQVEDVDLEGEEELAQR